VKLTKFSLKPSTLSVALSLVFLSGCMPEKQPDQWLQDKELVVQSLQDAHVANAKLKEDITALDSRILSLENIAEKQSATLAALEAELENEKVKSKTFAPKARISNTKDLNDRLDALSTKLNPTVVKTKDVKVPSLAEKNAYTAAYLALKSGRYDEASSGFAAVVEAYPSGEYTDQAYYWLGESLVAQRRNKEAEAAYSMVVQKYPDSPKHVVALLKLASVYQSLGQMGDAKATLKRVIQDYPDSKSAERARMQLDNLSSNDGVKQ